MEGFRSSTSRDAGVENRADIIVRQNNVNPLYTYYICTSCALAGKLALEDGKASGAAPRSSATTPKPRWAPEKWINFSTESDTFPRSPDTSPRIFKIDMLGLANEDCHGSRCVHKRGCAYLRSQKSL